MAKLKIEKNYGIIPNDVLNSSRISFKAKGLFAFIQSKPDGWDFSAERISNQTNEGLTSVRTGLKELEKEGYLIRRKMHNQYGFFEIEYLLTENPFVENPTSVNPTLDNPTSENHINNSNKDYSKKESYNNTYNKKEVKQLSERKTEFFELVNNFSDLLGSEFDNFFNYWAEPSKSGKMRFEAEKFFDVQRRINTWMQRANPKKNNTFEMSKTESVFRTINQAKEELLNDLANGNSTIFEKF